MKEAPSFGLPDLRVAEFDGANAGEQELAAIAAFRRAAHLERLASDYPEHLELTRSDLAVVPSFRRVRRFKAERPDGVVVGEAAVTLETADNQHLCEVELRVRSEHRELGLGKRLLARVVEVAEQERRSLLMSSTLEGVPSGAAFARRLGAEKGLRRHTYRLSRPEIDRSLVHRWLDANLGDYELVRDEGLYKDEMLGEIVDLYHVVNAEPRGTLDTEDKVLSTEGAREVEKTWLAARGERRGLFARHEPSGELVGWTEALTFPCAPSDAISIGTGVRPEHRGKGLGQHLRAALVADLFDEEPGVERCWMEIAETNGAMRSISERLGFTAVEAVDLWQLPTAKAREYLENG